MAARTGKKRSINSSARRPGRWEITQKQRRNPGGTMSPELSRVSANLTRAIRPTAIPMIAIMWQFDVKHGRDAEFEELYGVEGEWTALNRQTRSYLGTSFLRDQNR